MIFTKADLKEYLKADKRQLGISRKRPRPFTDEIWKFEIILRKYEFYINNRGVFINLMRFFYKVKYHRMGIKLGIGIAPNTCGKGLSIAHINGININPAARIGENLRIQECVTIGASRRGVPRIGDNVFLGSGCKVMGNAYIPDKCVVGANSVVTKTIKEKGITVAGVPARKINDKNSDDFVFWFKKQEN